MAGSPVVRLRVAGLLKLHVAGLRAAFRYSNALA